MVRRLKAEIVIEAKDVKTEEGERSEILRQSMDYMEGRPVQRDRKTQGKGKRRMS